MGLGTLGRRQVTPVWVNDPVWRHDGQQGREGRGMSGLPPPGGHGVDVREGRRGNKRNRYITNSDGA